MALSFGGNMGQDTPLFPPLLRGEDKGGPERSLVIEVDGDIHAKENQIIKDKEREIFLRNLGLHVIRYMNDDILKNLNAVLEDLYEKLSSASTSPPPPYKGGDKKSPLPFVRGGQVGQRYKKWGWARDLKR